MAFKLTSQSIWTFRNTVLSENSKFLVENFWSQIGPKTDFGSILVRFRHVGLEKIDYEKFVDSKKFLHVKMSTAPNGTAAMIRATFEGEISRIVLHVKKKKKKIFQFAVKSLFQEIES